jgi:hypothetical protein
MSIDKKSRKTKRPQHQANREDQRATGYGRRGEAQVGMGELLGWRSTNAVRQVQVAPKRKGHLLARSPDNRRICLSNSYRTVVLRPAETRPEDAHE